jgi:hypothetical protein
MIAILALATAVYMLYSTYLVGAGGEALAIVDDLTLPADLVFVGRRTLSPAEVQDISRRGTVDACEAVRVIWYKSAAGYVRLVSLPPESRLWEQLLAGGSGASLPGPQEVLASPEVAELLRVSAGEGVTLIPPQATAGVFTLRLAGLHGADDDMLSSCLITQLTPTGPRPNALLVWTRTPAAARSLATVLELEYGAPGRPYTQRMDDAYVLVASTPAAFGGQVLAQTYMPGVSALGLVFIFCGIGLFCITSLSFMDRRRDLAILKTVGLESRGLVALLLIEQGLIAVSGVGLGTLLALSLLAKLGDLFPGSASLSAVTVLKGAFVGAAVLGAAVILPAALAKAATVNQLLYNLPVSLYRQRVGGDPAGS